MSNRRKLTTKAKKEKRAIIDLILGTFLLGFGITLFIWGYKQISSPTPFGVTAETLSGDGTIIGDWMIVFFVSFSLTIPFMFALRNLLHIMARTVITIDEVHQETAQNSHIVVSGYKNSDNIKKKFLLLSEITDSATLVLDLSNFKLFFAKIETNLSVRDIKELKITNKKLLYTLNKDAWSK